MIPEPPWLAPIRDRLGRVPDRVLGDEAGVVPSTIANWRKRFGIPTFFPPVAARPVNLARYTTLTALRCQNPACGIDFLGVPSAVNRARKNGGDVKFCSRRCFVAAHPRIGTGAMSAEERRAAKPEYDRQRRAALGEDLKRKKREAYYAEHATHLAKMAEARKSPEFKAKMRAYQREHTTRPEWKAHKRSYDRVFRAMRDYGEEWGPAAVALLQLTDAVAERATKQECYEANGILNKSQQRRRDGSSKAQCRRAQGRSLERDERCSAGEPGPGDRGLDGDVGAGDLAYGQGPDAGVFAVCHEDADGADRLREPARGQQAGRAARGVVNGRGATSRRGAP